MAINGIRAPNENIGAFSYRELPRIVISERGGWTYGLFISGAPRRTRFMVGRFNSVPRPLIGRHEGGSRISLTPPDVGALPNLRNAWSLSVFIPPARSILVVCNLRGKRLGSCTTVLVPLRVVDDRGSSWYFAGMPRH